jgi:hypothetical protein
MPRAPSGGPEGRAHQHAQSRGARGVQWEVRRTLYLGNPATGVRGIHHHIVTSLGGRPAHGTAALTAQAYDVLAGEAAERAAPRC